MHDLPFHIDQVASLLPLKFRYKAGNSIYVDCPFCGDHESGGHMNLNYDNDTWRCVLCDSGGGMLDLYAGFYGVTRGVACAEICESLGIASRKHPHVRSSAIKKRPVVFHQTVEKIAQSKTASQETIHETLTALLHMLGLDQRDRQSLRDRGLSDQQIDVLGYRSTPPPFACLPLTDKLLEAGHIVQGVPGFYLNAEGRWTVKFKARTSGIMIPVRTLYGMTAGIQIRLHKPLRDPARPNKKGAKYIWLASTTEHMGAGNRSAAHLVGDPHAKTVYVTEGYLKADVAHCLSGRTFATAGGANNAKALDELISILADNGTEEIIEAMDMDKFRKATVAQGAAVVVQLAQKYGLRCRCLTWDARYKGIDDWLWGQVQQTAAEPRTNAAA